MKLAIIAALALFSAPAYAKTVHLSPDQVRAVACRGPVATIPDDDPGLALYRHAIAKRGIESAKVDLAFWRGETCGDSERGIWDEDQDTILVDRSEYEAIELRICGPNGSVSRDEEGPVCSDPDPQPWSCEDYSADRQTLWPGCIHEPRGRD